MHFPSSGHLSPFSPFPYRRRPVSPSPIYFNPPLLFFYRGPSISSSFDYFSSVSVFLLALLVSPLKIRHEDSSPLLSLTRREGEGGRKARCLSRPGEKRGRGKMSRWHVLGIPRKKKKNKLYCRARASGGEPTFFKKNGLTDRGLTDGVLATTEVKNPVQKEKWKMGKPRDGPFYLRRSRQVLELCKLLLLGWLLLWEGEQFV